MRQTRKTAARGSGGGRENDDVAEKDDQVQPQKKRLRVSRACDQCRRKRDRCDGQQPSCRSCLNSKRTCTYNESTKKRGLPAGYVRAMETMLGLVFYCIEGSEDLISALLTDEEGDLSVKAFPLARPNAVYRSAKSLLNIWRDSRVVKQVENLLLATESSEDDEEASFLQQVDDKLSHLFTAMSNRNEEHVTMGQEINVASSSNEADSSPILSNAEDTLMHGSVNQESEMSIPEPSAHDITMPITNIHDDIPRHPDMSLQSRQTGLELFPQNNQNKSLSLPPHWSQLLDLYFAKTHCWFPISQKFDLLRTAHTLANNTSLDSNTGDIAPFGESTFLWAVMTYTSYQCEASGITFDRPSDENASQPPTSPQELYSYTLSLLPVDSPSYEAGHVRALLILALIHIGRASWTSAWTLVGRAVYIAVDLQMIPAHQSEEQKTHNKKRNDEDGSKRAALGCFMLDALASAHLERRPYLRRSDLRNIGLMQVDSNEEWETLQISNLLDGNTSLLESPVSHRQGPGRILSTYNMLMGLLALFNDLMCLPSENNDDDNGSEAGENPQLKQNLWKLSQELEDWKEYLPAHCQIPQSDTESTLPSPHLLNLYLAHSSVAQILRLKSALVYSGEGRIEPVVSSSLINRCRQVISLISHQKQSLGGMVITPIVQIYLRFLSKAIFLLGNDPTVSIEATNISSKIDQLIQDAEGIWQIRKPISRDQEQETRQESYISIDSSMLQYPPPLDMQGPTKDTTHHPQALISSFSNIGATLSPVSDFGRRQRVARQSQHSQSINVDRFSTNTMMTPLSTQDLGFGSMGDPLVNQAVEEDALFRGLAMLDPVDW